MINIIDIKINRFIINKFTGLNKIKEKKVSENLLDYSDNALNKITFQN